ncbi:MAG: hypothetical protein ACRD4M_11710, partial [Candidatus Acidiferrales bacterium]
MTWIVGTTTMFGYGLGISDIRVTLRDGSEHDCLQKIYKVGNFIAAGFAGSVAIGFAMVDRLTELLASDDMTRAWDPAAVAEWWPQDARAVFDGFPQEEREFQSHLILIGAHPNEHNGNPAWPKTYVYKCCSPSFEPVMAAPSEIVAIGCGTQFEPCRAAIRSLSNDHDARLNLMRGEINCIGGMGSLLGFTLTKMLQETQPSGISSHLHACWVFRGRVVIAPNNYGEIGRWKNFSSGVDAAEKQLHESSRGSKNPLVAPGMKIH